MTDFAKNCVYLTLAGSHSYGTALPTSDFDIKGVIVPPKRYFSGFNSHFEQLEDKVEITNKFGSLVPGLKEGEQLDGVLYDIRKYFKLASDCNPNVLEPLFVRSEDILYQHPCFAPVLENREKFLSRRALHTYKGYSFSQLKRMKTHREWLMNPPQKKPERLDFGLNEHTTKVNKELRDFLFSKIRGIIDSWRFDLSEVKAAVRDDIMERVTNYVESLTADVQYTEFHAAGKQLGLDDNILEELDKERKFKAALDYYNQYQNWERNRNPVRHEIEKRLGYDSKNALHLVRLLTTCEQILKTGTFETYRPDRQFLLDIRAGSMTYDEIINWSTQKNDELDKLAETSSLKKKPDINFLEELQMSVVDQYL